MFPSGEKNNTLISYRSRPTERYIKHFQTEMKESKNVKNHKRHRCPYTYLLLITTVPSIQLTPFCFCMDIYELRNKDCSFLYNFWISKRIHWSRTVKEKKASSDETFCVCTFLVLFSPFYPLWKLDAPPGLNSNQF